MDIREVAPGSTPAPPPGRRVSRPTSAAGPSGGGSVDRVTLSGRARSLENTRQASLAVPDTRKDRVREVRRALARGEIVPDAQRIAASLLAQGVLA